MNRIKVNLDRKTSKSYDVCIGRAIMDRTALVLAKNNWASRYVIITIPSWKSFTAEGY